MYTSRLDLLCQGHSGCSNVQTSGNDRTVLFLEKLDVARSNPGAERKGGSVGNQRAGPPWRGGLWPSLSINPMSQSYVCSLWLVAGG